MFDNGGGAGSTEVAGALSPASIDVATADGGET